MHGAPQPTPKPTRQPPTPEQVIMQITDKLQWPDGKYHSSYEEKALEMMSQWQQLIKGRVATRGHWTHADGDHVNNGESRAKAAV